jgi:hypothetical protein
MSWLHLRSVVAGPSYLPDSQISSFIFPLLSKLSLLYICTSHFYGHLLPPLPVPLFCYLLLPLCPNFAMLKML